MSKLNTNISFLEDFWNSKGIDFNEMFDYVVNNKDFNLELKEFYIIENGFREKWNQESGNIIGDSDIKNATYRFIEKEFADTNTELINQKKVDAIIDLILDYMISIGQWYSDMSKS